jgi:DNA-binding SARP family transcriptional activator
MGEDERPRRIFVIRHSSFVVDQMYKGEEFIMARATLFMVTASVAIVVYLGLAIHVITRNPRRLISWIFGAFCSTVVSYYLSSLFLFSGPAPPPITPFVLRWKWAAISFSATLYLHLVSFYFPPAWRRTRPWVLASAYLLSAGFALAALFTNLLVAGPLYRPPPLIIGPLPGPLMYVCAGFFSLEVIGGTAGLVAGYRASLSPSLRNQILYLLIPTGLAFLSGAVDWIIVLTQDANLIPHELSDGMLILAAFFYASAVLRYGSFVGRPIARRELFYSALATAVGLVALYPIQILDRWLAAYTPFPYPLATGILVMAIAITFPVARRWATTRLDRLLFRAERQQRTMTYHLVEALAETPDPDELQAELLGALCAALRVRGGYVALSDLDSPPGTWTVRTVQGKVSVQPGDQVRQPPLRGMEPQLVAALLPHQQTEPGWRDMALFCPLAANSASGGVLALGEKRDGEPFTPEDLALCAELAERVHATGHMTRLREQRNGYLQAARLHDQALRRLEEKVAASVHQVLTARERQPLSPAEAPLDIRLLGPLQVIREGELVPEAAWGTEKAKGMLAYLLWKGPAGATREEISAVLWPDRLPEETANVFHVTLHRLRRVLEPEPRAGHGARYIRYELGRYCFNADAPHWLDARAFRTLVDVWKPAALREAVALYRGPYMEDMDWALPTEAEADQRALEGLYVDVLRRLAAWVEESEAGTYLERLLAIEPADETAQRTLVAGYLARGRRDLARRQVARWQETLADLGLEPSPEAMALWDVVENGATVDITIRN